MKNFNIKHLESSMSAIVNGFQGEKEVLSMIQPKFEILKRSFDGQRIKYSLDQYIRSELDFKTNGERGLGRLTDFTPRLGGYFREPMSKLSQIEIVELYNLIQDLMLRGYIFYALFMENEIRENITINSEDLYQRWVPGIYTSDSSEMKENVKNLFEACIYSAYNLLKKFLINHQMKGGGFFSKDKTDNIIYYYALAGWGLRLVETGRG
ncbi:MAG: hypothetical protein HQ538_06170 [Parcubacteria group bacterium]|nr:hypothetical protein [Parcubacteria group bacterium]